MDVIYGCHTRMIKYIICHVLSIWMVKLPLLLVRKIVILCFNCTALFLGQVFFYNHFVQCTTLLNLTG